MTAITSAQRTVSLRELVPRDRLVENGCVAGPWRRDSRLAVERFVSGYGFSRIKEFQVDDRLQQPPQRLKADSTCSLCGTAESHALTRISQIQGSGCDECHRRLQNGSIQERQRLKGFVSGYGFSRIEKFQNSMTGFSRRRRARGPAPPLALLHSKARARAHRSACPSHDRAELCLISSSGRVL